MIVLSGGTGTPKLLVGLKRAFEKERERKREEEGRGGSREGEWEGLKIIVNTAEDVWVSGNLVCPDLDSVLYALAGEIDREKWWGVQDDSFCTHTALRRLGCGLGSGLGSGLGRGLGRECEESLKIGDKDRATHIFRSELLRSGKSLTEATALLARQFGIPEWIKILPMTDAPASVSTRILTPAGELHFQEFWVARRGEPEVLDVYFDGVEEVRASEEVVCALASGSEEKVLIGPSNPITSVGPILSLRGVREMLRRKKVVAVSPILGSEPVSGPAAKFMRAKGFEVSACGVFKCYEDFLDALVVEKGDKEAECQVGGGKILKTEILIKNDAESERLAKFLREDV